MINSKRTITSLTRNIAIVIVCIFGLSTVIGTGGGGGDGGDNSGGGTNHPPVSEMTFQETYDLTIADRRETFLSTLGNPDTFRIEVTEIEGRTVVSEEWSYINLGVRLDIVDGEVAYVIPIDSVELELALLPRFYSPAEFSPPMNKSEAMEFLEGQTLKEQNLSEGGFFGAEMVAGDQIVLGFDGDQLVYVETFALIPDPEGEMDNLFIDDFTANTGLTVDGGQKGLFKGTSSDGGEVERALAPHIIKGIFGIFRAFNKRNKAYREINAMLRDYRDYIQQLHDKVEELALDPCQNLNLLDEHSYHPRISNGGTLVRLKTRLIEELNAVTALLEDDKNETRKNFERELIKTFTEYLTESGALAKVLNKIGVIEIRDSISELDTFISGVYDPGNLQNFHTKLTERMGKLGVFGEMIGGAVGSRLNQVIAKIQRLMPGVKQAQQVALEEIQPLLQEADQFLANIQDQFSPDKEKQTYTPSQLVGNLEALFKVLDDPAVDALSAALAKEMEPGIAKNMHIANGRLDPRQFVSLRERIRGAILKSGVERIEALKPGDCGKKDAQTLRKEFEISARMQVAGIFNANSEILSNETIVSPLDEQYSGHFGAGGYPIRVCPVFPVDLNAVAHQTIADIENDTLIEFPDDVCRFDYDEDGVNGRHAGGDDCDDRNSKRFPGNAEICDDIDNDCNSKIDDGLSTDADDDGHFNKVSCAEPADDCNDENDLIYPGAVEICDDLIDNDCNDEVDCDDSACEESLICEQETKHCSMQGTDLVHVDTNDDPSDGTYIACSYHANEQLSVETPMTDYKRDGIEKSYYDSGQLRSVLPYTDGERNGVKKWYYESGQLKYEEPYTDNKRNGVRKEYYESGQLRFEIPYADDKRNGVSKEYYESGQLDNERTYTNGVLNGVARDYDFEGTLTHCFLWVNGTRAESCL